MYNNDWSLSAVVSGYLNAQSSAAPPPPSPQFTPNYFDNDSFLFNLPDTGDYSLQCLQETYQELCGDYAPPPPPPPLFSQPYTEFAPMLHLPPPPPPPMLHQPPPPPMMHLTPPPPPQSYKNMQMWRVNNRGFDVPSTGGSFSGYNVVQPPRKPAPKSPRKKKAPISKRLCLTPSAEIDVDLTSWRKYGQKMIKGSKHPRSYYRCSASKGCSARKQMERHPDDASTYIVYYTGEHTHPRIPPMQTRNRKRKAAAAAAAARRAASNAAAEAGKGLVVEDEPTVTPSVEDLKFMEEDDLTFAEALKEWPAADN